MEDVLDVYKQPYDPKRPVVCMDELSKQLVGEVRQPLPAQPGQPERYDCEYVRNGTANVFMWFEPLAGRRQVKVTGQRTRVDWAPCIKEIVDDYYSQAERIVLVMDNLHTHAKSSLYETFAPEEAKRLADKLEIHYTPQHGSWLNVAESELSHLSRQCLDRRIPDAQTLKEEIFAWNKNRNNAAAPVDWQFTAADARIKLKRLYPTILHG